MSRIRVQELVDDVWVDRYVNTTAPDSVECQARWDVPGPDNGFWIQRQTGRFRIRIYGFDRNDTLGQAGGTNVKSRGSQDYLRIQSLTMFPEEYRDAVAAGILNPLDMQMRARDLDTQDVLFDATRTGATIRMQIQDNAHTGDDLIQIRSDGLRLELEAQGYKADGILELTEGDPDYWEITLVAQ